MVVKASPNKEKMYGGKGLLIAGVFCYTKSIECTHPWSIDCHFLTKQATVKVKTSINMTLDIIIVNKITMIISLSS